MPSLGTSFGRGAATSFQADLQYSDCILIMGSNMAEAHPVGFRFVMKARESGAQVIHVDPHFSRTSAAATTYVPIRAGSDIVFLGALINQVLMQERWFTEYVLAYTNATTVIDGRYADTESDLSGLFSGFDEASATYAPREPSWQYVRSQTTDIWSEASADAPPAGRPVTDPTLSHPNCVLNILRRHFARYTPELVAQQCGCTVEAFMQVAEALMANSGRERTSAVVYALGWTQHTTGVQTIRAAAILQLLLGNMGRPGGGIMAMRGHASIQGSTDIPTLYNLLPGYLPQPDANKNHQTLNDYLAAEGLSTGVWAAMPAFTVSLLKAWFGESATAHNEFGFGSLPRIDRDFSQLAQTLEMASGTMRGYFLMGQNPAAGAPNAALNRAALRQLKWLVVRDLFLIESATFWKEGPDQPDPTTIGTEVFFMPAASGIEKAGTLTNTERMVQWHDQAVDPPGDCRSELWFMWQLGLRLKALYADSQHQRDWPIRHLTWDYAHLAPLCLPDGRESQTVGDPDAARVLREINGSTVASGEQLHSFDALRADGSTACGCWIYCGVYPEEQRNRAAERVASPTDRVYGQWAWAWPANRRLLYNRASADPAGAPWSERKRYVWWDEAAKTWTGPDVPDFEPSKRPDYRPPAGATGMAAIAGDAPFVMKPDGRGWLFAPAGLADGPLPTHFEPVESPVPNPLYKQQTNPTVRIPRHELNTLAESGSYDFPHVGTTYRVTEHYLSGPMSRFDSWLNELQPAMFVELNESLARDHAIVLGDWVVVSSRRGAIEARALVTDRMPPLTVHGRILHQIGVPIHFGAAGEVAGSAANELTSIVLDANVSMHEGKVFACAIRKGRLAQRSDIPSEPTFTRPHTGDMPDTADNAQPEGHDA